MFIILHFRDELRRILRIPEPCNEGDTDILNIHFAGCFNCVNISMYLFIDDK